MPRWRLPLGSPPSFLSRSVLVVLFDTTRQSPQLSGCSEGINGLFDPPRLLVSETMVVLMVGAAKRDGELVANLEAHRPRLSKPKVAGVGGPSFAKQAGMRCHKFEVGFVAKAALLADGKLAWLDI
jgi:hypothetical protein